MRRGEIGADALWRMLTELDDRMAVLRAEDVSPTTLSGVVFCRGFVDHVSGIEALAIIAEVRTVVGGVGAVLSDVCDDVDEKGGAGGTSAERCGRRVSTSICLTVAVVVQRTTVFPTAQRVDRAAFRPLSIHNLDAPRLPKFNHVIQSSPRHFCVCMCV